MTDPQLLSNPNNPGISSSFGVAYPDGQGGTRGQEIDLLPLLAQVLTQNGHASQIRQGWVWLPEGLWLLPKYLHLEGGEDFKTTTTLEVTATGGLFQGLFEYQHSHSADSMEDSLKDGFTAWILGDLPVYLDALNVEPKHCIAMNLDVPADGQNAAYSRRILLGPVAHYVQFPERPDDEEHPFCNCCLFTNTAQVFMERLQDPEIRIVRFYAARDAKGQALADCRVNGEDDAPGHAELLKYVPSWPQRGVEFRKQLILIQPRPTAPGLGEQLSRLFA